MSTSRTIQHRGIIEEITEKGIRVKFTSKSACADCHAKGMCSAADLKEKEVLVKDNSTDFNSGDTVNLVITTGQGSRAVMLGYVYPFLVFLTCLLILNGIGLNELQTGLISLAVIVPYYLIIYILRGKISKSFKFSIRKAG